MTMSAVYYIANKENNYRNLKCN